MDISQVLLQELPGLKPLAAYFTRQVQLLVLPLVVADQGRFVLKFLVAVTAIELGNVHVLGFEVVFEPSLTVHLLVAQMADE